MLSLSSLRKMLFKSLHVFSVLDKRFFIKKKEKRYKKKSLLFANNKISICESPFYDDNNWRKFDLKSRDEWKRKFLKILNYFLILQFSTWIQFEYKFQFSPICLPFVINIFAMRCLMLLLKKFEIPEFYMSSMNIVYLSED